MLSRTNFVELDCSFEVFKPYVYSIPHGIIQNESVPLGLIIGPSETHEIFSLFYDFIKTCDIESYNLIKKAPLLSDQGSGLIKFAKIEDLIHFFCLKHIIDKFGSSTPISSITKDLLYCGTETEFKEYINKKQLKDYFSTRGDQF